MEAEGSGAYMDKTTIEVDKLFPAKNSFAAFVKKDILDMPEKFFEHATSSECIKRMYVLNYDKSIDTSLKKVAAVYHADKHRLTISLESNMSERNFFYYLKKYSIEVFVESSGFFRWFKFTLKPPYSIAHDKLRLAIWDTSFWTFWLKFGHKGP